MDSWPDCGFPLLEITLEHWAIVLLRLFSSLDFFAGVYPFTPIARYTGVMNIKDYKLLDSSVSLPLVQG